METVSNQFYSLRVCNNIEYYDRLNDQCVLCKDREGYELDNQDFSLNFEDSICTDCDSTPSSEYEREKLEFLCNNKEMMLSS